MFESIVHRLVIGVTSVSKKAKTTDKLENILVSLEEVLSYLLEIYETEDASAKTESKMHSFQMATNWTPNQCAKTLLMIDLRYNAVLTECPIKNNTIGKLPDAVDNNTPSNWGIKKTETIYDLARHIASLHSIQSKTPHRRACGPKTRKRSFQIRRFGKNLSPVNSVTSSSHSTQGLRDSLHQNLSQTIQTLLKRAVTHNPVDSIENGLEKLGASQEQILLT